MPPKKKGKGNKLARMTEEERLRYMQHRAAIEEEARRRKQQLIALFMKNKLKHEEAFTRINIAKINQQWRQILRQIKTQELRQEVETLSQSFENALNRKNLVISEMLNDLDEADDQYSMILQSHTEIVDQLIALHSTRLTELNRSFVVERDLLLDSRSDSRKQISSLTDAANRYLSTVIYSGSAGQKLNDVDFSRYHDLRLDEARDAMLGDIDRVTIQCESRMEQIWHQFCLVINKYQAETETNRTQYNKLQVKDVANAQELHKCFLRANHLTELINNLKTGTDLKNQEQINCVEDLKDEKNHLVAYFFDLRSKFKRDIQMDKKKFTHLTLQSNMAIKNLESLNTKGERIMQLVIACGKMETEREKVIPFGIDADNKEEEEPTQDSSSLNESIAKEMFHFSKLDNFWRRYNQVYLERAALSLHQEALAVENRQLKAAVKHYLSSISKHGQPEPRPSTTQLRKHVTMIPSGRNGEPRRARPVTCIEASTSNAVRHMLRTSAL